MILCPFARLQSQIKEILETADRELEQDTKELCLTTASISRAEIAAARNEHFSQPFSKPMPLGDASDFETGALWLADKLGVTVTE